MPDLVWHFWGTVRARKRPERPDHPREEARQNRGFRRPQILCLGWEAEGEISRLFWLAAVCVCFIPYFASFFFNIRDQDRQDRVRRNRVRLLMISRECIGLS